MKYIVNSKEISRDTFYFCQKAKEENKSFVLLKKNNSYDVEKYINNHPEYDYYICDEVAIYYTKGDKDFKEWFDKDHGWSTCTIDDMKKKYNKSKFKDTITYEEWYTKNGWTLNSETKYKKECHGIPTQEDFEEKEVRTKLFSVKVTNDDTIKTLNEIREKYGEYCIEYVLRDYTFTEIIYKDTYKEI